ncbi:MAG: alpha/beta fold hydrolase [Acidobacteriota bacterium]
MPRITSYAPLWFSLIVAAPAVAEEPAAPPAVEEVAVEIVDLMAAGKHDEVVARFDATMKEALPADKLRATWDAITGQVGAFRERAGTRTEKVQGYDVVFVTCRFENATLDAKVVLNAERQVAGLFFVPSTPAAEPSGLPDYADPGRYRERDVQVGEAWPLPGTLTLPVPDGEGAPGVVLVHGSGPQDRDETVGPNKPFRDLAVGLATAGIAVLRYDKRSQVHAARLAAVADLTVEGEVIEDAVEAVALLRSTPGIDPGKVFVLGHSLGGMLVPRIAARVPEVAGFIVMAGAARPLHETMVLQVRYLAGLDGEVSKEERDRIAALEREVARIAALGPDAAAGDLILGAPASYWIDLQGYRPAEAARKVDRPLLILQGGRDYQVTREDYDAWRRALDDRPDVRFRVFEDLNHLFLAGVGPSRPEEYEQAGHVAKAVIDEIAVWIRAIIVA